MAKKSKSTNHKKPTEKKPKKATRSISKKRVIAMSFLVVFLLVASVATVIGINVFKDLPSPKNLQSDAYPVSTQIFDRHNTLLYEIYADQHRNPIPLEDIPKDVIHATIAIEDQNFYSHFGFSVQGIARAFKNTIFSDKLQGGSTITQQLVKTALLTPERTIRRKLREAVLTIGTEALYTKDEIIEMYLNHIPYGGTAYGIEAAAKKLFDKPASDLNLAESSLLAGLPQAPSRYSPYINPDQAKARQYEVLRRMVEDEYITQDEADKAFQSNLTFAPPATDIKAPHFVFYVRDILEQKYGLDTVEKGGLRVTTSLDLELQEYAQASVSAEVADLSDYDVSNGAALVTKPATGEILAMIGSIDYFDTENDGQVNLTNRLRQPGSSIKPINYVTALQLQKLNPASMLLDIPTCFQVPGQPGYCPKNYDGSFHGPVRFRDALANSYNIPAVKILAVNGLESMIATASAMGISTFNDPSRYGLSLTLGGGEVTMLDMSTAFGTLANQGVKVPLNPILKVTNVSGEILEEHDPQKVEKAIMDVFFDESNPDSDVIGTAYQNAVRALNRAPAFLISHILADNNARAPAFGTNSELRIRDYTVSAKTGTTNDLRDNWTLGYTNDYVVASWVGNNDNSPMNGRVVSGVTGAAPIFNDIMSYLLESQEPEDTKLLEPISVEGTNVCRLTGLYPRDEEPCQIYFEYFWKGAFPEEYHNTQKNIWVFKDSGRPAFLDTGDKKPEGEPENLDNLELQTKTVLTDPFIDEFCTDCNWANPETGKFDYPTIQVDMTKFYLPTNEI